jgi:hypothetical protein
MKPLRTTNSAIKMLTMVLMVLTLLISPASPALGFEVPIHKQITKDGLGFLRSNILSEVEDAVDNADTFPPFGHEWHFDNCLFQQATQTINNSYGIALTALDPSDPDLDAALTAFGELLHPVQDFYSHSNWIELEKIELIDDGLGLWTVLEPFSVVKGVVVVQGEDFEKPFIPSGYILDRNGKVVTVATASETLPGLITGLSEPSVHEVPLLGIPLPIASVDDDCPNNVTLRHSVLNKDGPERPKYTEARKLATQQTTHEWCRLVNLVSAHYGQQGLWFLFDIWVEDERAAVSACLDAQTARIIHIDRTFAGSPELGTQENPFRQFRDGTIAVWHGGTVIIHPGRYPANGTYSKPMILRAIEGEVMLEGSP